eukprot:363433-Chlamydomonas_euryale.AAC.16
MYRRQVVAQHRGRRLVHPPQPPQPRAVVGVRSTCLDPHKCVRHSRNGRATSLNVPAHEVWHVGC